jgi:hypothetical protein
MANSYKNIVITPNTNQGGDPTIVFSGGNANINVDITTRIYPDSNGTLSFEGTAGQLFSITNDLTGIIFSVNDVSGIPSISVANTGNVALAEITGNVGIGRSNPTYLLDVKGTVNAASYLINGLSVQNTSNGYANTVALYSNNWANTRTSPTSIQSASYILAIGDLGRLIIANGANIYVTSGVFTSGQNISVYNNTAVNLTITQNTGATLYLAGGATAGNRTLAQRGYATISCLFGNTFVVSGTGVT